MSLLSKIQLVITANQVFELLAEFDRSFEMDIDSGHNT